MTTYSQANVPQAAVLRPDAQAAQRTNVILTLIQFTFYLFLFCIPFETADTGAGISPTRITGAIFFLVALMAPTITFSRPPRMFAWFGIFGAFFLALCLNTTSPGPIVMLGGLIVQMLALMWITYNLMRSEKIARYGLMAFAAGCICLALVLLLGLSTRGGSGVGANYRASAAGQNPNGLAAVMAIGIVAVLGLAHRGERTSLPLTLLAWAVAVIQVIAIVKTGSRGALIAVGAGLLCFAFQGTNVRVTVRNVIIVCLMMWCLTWFTSNNEMASRRWEKTLAGGQMGQREEIAEVGWQMVRERPFTGWGAGADLIELGSRVGADEKDSHDTYLKALLVTGVFGGIPFLIGCLACLRSAWRARARLHGIVPFALVVTVLAISFTADLLYRKQFWWIIAYGFVAALYPLRTAPAVNAAVGRKPREL